MQTEINSLADLIIQSDYYRRKIIV